MTFRVFNEERCHYHWNRSPNSWRKTPTASRGTTTTGSNDVNDDDDRILATTGAHTTNQSRTIGTQNAALDQIRKKTVITINLVSLMIIIIIILIIIILKAIPTSTRNQNHCANSFHSKELICLHFLGQLRLLHYRRHLSFLYSPINSSL